MAVAIELVGCSSRVHITLRSIGTTDVIEWLQKLDQENPFDLVFCRHDVAGVGFRGAVKGVKKLAERVAEFCPSCLDNGAANPKNSRSC